MDPFHISCHKKLELIQSKYGWSTLDARVLVFYNLCSLTENLGLILSTIFFAKGNGLHSKQWWKGWAGYQDQAFRKIPDFDTYVNDQVRQSIHRVQEQLVFTSQIYIEAFIRNTSRQLGIERDAFWQLKRDFLKAQLGLSDDDLLPITILQHLRNTIHNKGIHHSPRNPQLRYNLNGYVFSFDHDQAVMVSWDHYSELLLATSEVLLKIVENPKVVALPEYSDKNIVVIQDEDENSER